MWSNGKVNPVCNFDSSSIRILTWNLIKTWIGYKIFSKSSDQKQSKPTRFEPAFRSKITFQLIVPRTGSRRPIAINHKESEYDSTAIELTSVQLWAKSWPSGHTTCLQHAYIQTISKLRWLFVSFDLCESARSAPGHWFVGSLTRAEQPPDPGSFIYVSFLFKATCT